MQRKKDEVKKKILDIAHKYFLDKGFPNSSMRSIAQESGISPGNIYTYFQSKEDLFLYLLTEHQIIRLEFMFKKMQQGRTGWEKIKIYADEYFKYIQKQSDSLRLGVYWEFHGLDESKISREIMEKRKSIFSTFDLWDVFLEGKKDGSIREDLEKEIYISFTMIIRLLMNEILVLKYKNSDFYYKYLDFFLDAISKK